MQLSEMFNDQSLICKELVLGEAITENVAVMINDENKLVPATSADAVIGVAEPVIMAVNGYMKAVADVTTRTFIKGVAVCKVTGDVVNGQKLTVDTANPGSLKVAGATDKVVAIALSKSTDIARILLL